MARTIGARNADHDQTRDRLAAEAFRRLCAPDGSRVSLRELAAAAGVTVPTMKHYFGDRSGVISAALGHARNLGAPYLLMLTRPPDGPIRESLLETIRFLVAGWPFGLDKCHVVGLTQGLDDDALGPAYVRDVLEPTVQAFEARLAHYAARGELSRCSLRVASLTLISPVLVALLHQGPLGGRACRPLDMDEFVVEHVSRWLESYASRGSERASVAPSTSAD
jgi:AcrR family transcriptional regulator